MHNFCITKQNKHTSAILTIILASGTSDRDPTQKYNDKTLPFSIRYCSSSWKLHHKLQAEPFIFQSAIDLSRFPTVNCSRESPSSSSWIMSYHISKIVQENHLFLPNIYWVQIIPKLALALTILMSFILFSTISILLSLFLMDLQSIKFNAQFLVQHVIRQNFNSNLEE